MKRAYRVVWSAGLSLSLNLLALPAHADSLFVGAGGSGGTSTADDGVNDFNGAAGGIAGGNGGKGYYTQGAGGGGSLVTGTVDNPGSTATSSGLGTTTYDYVVVGGGGGGGSGTTNGTAGDGTGGTGGQGALTVDGSGLTVNQTLYVGGFGGGAGGGEVFTRGGNGGTGGAGAATLTGGGATTANGVVVGGVEGFGGVSGAETGAVGAGGSGTLNLGGGSTLSIGAGGIVLNGNGTLNIGNGTANGASAGTLTSASGITDNGVIDFNQSDASYTFNTNISGSGKVVQNAGGTTILSGNNGYTGGTTVNAGYLGFSASSNLGTGGITLNGGGLQWTAGSTADISNQAITLGTGGGTLAVNGNNVTLSSGSLRGAGSLTVAGGGGTLTLSGANSYTGATILDATSILALSGSGSIAASSGVVDNGTFDISGTTSGASIKTLTGSGTATLGTQNLTVANASGTYSGTFTGSGKLIVQGSGLWVLDGASSAFTGGAEVQGGTLEVGDSGTPGAVLGGNVLVDAAGTLRGHGTVQGDVANNGTVAPGGSIGTLTVSGNYTQASTATLSMEVSPTQASQLKVGGTASLAGTLGLAFDPGTYTSKQYTLVSAAGGRTGTFAAVDSTGASGLTYSLSYGANTVDLLLSGVVAPIDTSIYSAVGTATLMGAQSANAALLDRADALGGVSLRPGSGVWATLTGSRTKVDGEGSVPGFQNQRYGFLAGRDRSFDGYAAGLAFGYEHADIQEQNTGDTGKTDTLRAALYGNRALGPVNLSAVMGAGLDWLSQSRPFGAAGTAQGDHLGQEVTLGAQASLPLSLGSATALTPKLGLRYAYFHGNSFGESGADGQDLSVGSDNVQSLQPYAGLALDHVFGSAAHPARVQLRVGYAVEALDTNRGLVVAAQDGTRFAAPGASLPRGYLTAGLGLTLHPMKNLDVSLDYDALIHSGRASAQQGSLHVAYRF
jgi:outer membrane autotransporter protein